MLSLPAVDGQAGPPTPLPARLERLDAGRILVMEDHAAIQSLLRRGLERAGYTVVPTAAGEAAVREFERAKASGQPFDLVLLDVNIPGGMGGEETLTKLRQIEPSVLAVATTGEGADTVEALLHLGFARVVTKPFLVHELCATIRAVLPRAR